MGIKGCCICSFERGEEWLRISKNRPEEVCVGLSGEDPNPIMAKLAGISPSPEDFMDKLASLFDLDDKEVSE